MKPDNIFVDSTRLTKTGQVLGSFHYMPPEQMALGETSRSGDIYSLGVERGQKGA